MKNSFTQHTLTKKKETLGLKSGDKILVFAPSRSMNIISEDCQSLAKKRLAEMGLNVEYGKNVFDSLRYYDCGSVENRLFDLHSIFKNESISGALTVIGGFNVNQLLPYIDYDLIKSNPKVLCGFSDITALFNAIYAKTGMMTFYGPHFSSFGMKKGCDYTIEYFKKMIFEDDVVEIKPSSVYSDDLWFVDQDNREFVKNDGMFSINDGCAYGKLVGGNLCTLNLLQGTEYMPSLKDKILFIEDDDIVGDGFFKEFDRNLVSLMQTPDFSGVKGIIVGIAQKKCEMNRDKWKAMLNKKELKDIPIIVDVNFGHTTPICTIPIGGYCKLISDGNNSKIYMSKHDFNKNI